MNGKPRLSQMRKKPKHALSYRDQLAIDNEIVDDQLYSVRAASIKLNMAESSIRARIRSGKMPSIKVAASRRIRGHILRAILTDPEAFAA